MKRGYHIVDNLKMGMRIENQVETKKWLIYSGNPATKKTIS